MKGGIYFVCFSDFETGWRNRGRPGHDKSGANAARWFDPSGTGSPGQPGKEAALHLFDDFRRRRGLLPASKPSGYSAFFGWAGTAD